jgi:hypothetical protein
MFAVVFRSRSNIRNVRLPFNGASGCSSPPPPPTSGLCQHYQSRLTEIFFRHSRSEIRIDGRAMSITASNPIGMRLELRFKCSCAPAMHCTFARELRLSAVLETDRRRLHVSTDNFIVLRSETLRRALVSSPQTIITRLQPLVSVGA